MAHYVFQRNNGWGDYDYIRNFDTMEITDYPEFAAQVDDKYIPYIDIPYLNSLGFFPIGITSLALRIVPMLLFAPTVRGYRPKNKPRPARVKGAPMGPRPTSGPMPIPRAFGQRARVAVPKTAPRPAPRPSMPKPVGRPSRPGGPLMPGDKGPGGRGPGRR